MTFSWDTYKGERHLSESSNSSVDRNLHCAHDGLEILVFFFFKDNYFLMDSYKWCVCLSLKNEENNHFLLKNFKMWVILLQKTELD